MILEIVYQYNNIKYIIDRSMIFLVVSLLAPYIPFALLATLIFGFSSIGSKLLIPRLGGSFQYLAVQLPAGLLVLLISYSFFLPISSIFSYFSPRSFFLVFLAGVFGFSGFLCLNIGLAKGNSSVAGVVLSARVMFTIPLAVIFVNEIYPLSTYFFIFIALFGSILVSWRSDLEIKDFLLFKASGLRWFFLTIFFWALGNLMIRLVSDSLPLIVFLTSRQMLFAIFAIITYLISRRYYDIKPVSKDYEDLILVQLYMIVIIGAQASFVFAIGQALTITDAITSFQGVITLVTSFFLAKFVSNKTLAEPLDSSSISVRVVGALLATLGTLGVILSSQGVISIFGVT